jgi:hypothetical protein
MIERYSNPLQDIGCLRPIRRAVLNAETGPDSAGYNGSNNPTDLCSGNYDNSPNGDQ